MKVKLFAKHQAGHDRGFSSVVSRGINAGFSGQVCGGDLPTRRCTMSGEMTMAVVAVVTAMAFSALMSGSNNRGNVGTYQFAQYCVPQYDELSDMTRLYC